MVTLKQVANTIGFESKPIIYSYTPRDVCLYALGIGAPTNRLDQSELKFVYEQSPDFQVLPTFAVIYMSEWIRSFVTGKIGELVYNPVMLVHGEQYLEIRKPLSPSGTVSVYPRINGIYDKGSGMLLTSDVVCFDENGEQVAFMQLSMFVRGEGGFGGERGSSGDTIPLPDHAPDAIIEARTLEQQALLYRLSGDLNPLHADPQMAGAGGFESPILHGLCAFGFAIRAILRSFCNNDAALFKSARVRFANPVFPGETLVTEMWRHAGHEILFRTKVKERNTVVLSNANARLSEHDI